MLDDEEDAPSQNRKADEGKITRNQTREKTTTDSVTTHQYSEELYSRQHLDMVGMRVTRSFRGPLPPPETLAKYDAMDPGVDVVDRIIKIAESKQQHKQHTEKSALTALINDKKRGKNYAFVLSLVMIIGAIFLINGGHGILGTLFAGSTLLGLAYLFIAGKRKNNSPSQTS